MILPVSMTICILLVYILIMIFLLLGLTRLKPSFRHEFSVNEKVSLIIPYRNEAENLPLLLGDLMQQSYPEALFEVILINDHSTDGSGEIATSLVQDQPGFTSLELPAGVQGKKEALAMGISRVKNPWIIQTDADCRVGTDFLASHMAFLEENPSDLVAGLVTTWKGRGGLLEAFERLDMFGLTGAGAGSFSLGRPLMCSGANLLYSRNLYLETRKFDPADKLASGDDMFMLIGARKLKRKIRFNVHKNSMVRTSPVESPGALMRQRIRWGGKSASYRMWDIQFLALVVALASFGILLSPLWIRISETLPGWLIRAIAAKLILDFSILAFVAGKTGQGKTLWWFLPVTLLYYLYMPVLVVGSLLKPGSWKGRAFSKG